MKMRKIKTFRRLFLFDKLQNGCRSGNNCVIILPAVGTDAVGTVFYPSVRICEAAAAVFTKGIKGTITEQAVEFLG